MFNSKYKPNLQVNITALIFIILGICLFNLQVIQGQNYSHIAEKNYVRIKTIFPIRGEIYDRNYCPIVENRPSFNLYITLGKIENKENVIKFIVQNFNIELADVKEIFQKNRFRLYQEILLAQDVPYKIMVETSELMNFYPSLSYRTGTVRNYLYKNHFTGYVGRINEEEHHKLKDQGYSINSMIGKTGLEKYYESNLNGINGYEIIQVDASGRSLKFFKHNLTKSPQNGSDLILTIDNNLQEYISSIFPEDINGTVVISEVETGGILAYISKPDFDQNIFVNKLSSVAWNEMIQNPNKPMLDRVIHGTYPPGSSYKPIIASLGLESEIITRDTKLAQCKGGLNIGNRFFKCWLDKGHGKLNVVNAIKYSCDVFFYDLSTKCSLEQMNDYTKRSFLTVKTGIDLIGERSGFFPTYKWYVENYGKYVGIIGPKVNISIGQGEILVTPLQMCFYFNAIANNGKWIQPHILEKEIGEKRTILYSGITKNLPISTKNLEMIQESLYKAVNERYGTGVAASFPDIEVYGKTGSAENHMGKKTHAWFAGYVKWDKPEIAFVVFMENAGHGGSVAAPLAAKFIKYYDKMRIE